MNRHRNIKRELSLELAELNEKIARLQRVLVEPYNLKRTTIAKGEEIGAMYQQLTAMREYRSKLMGRIDLHKFDEE